MGIPDHLTCLLRNLYAGQEATVRTMHGTTDWFRIKKVVWQGCLLSPCLFNLYAEQIMAAVTICSDFGAPQNKVFHCYHCFPIYLPSSDGTICRDWSHEIKRCLLLGRKAMTNLYSIFKTRDITFPIKVHLVKAMIFLAVMYEFSANELMLLNCGVGEDSWESLGLQADLTSPF